LIFRRAHGILEKADNDIPDTLRKKEVKQWTRNHEVRWAASTPTLGATASRSAIFAGCPLRTCADGLTLDLFAVRWGGVFRCVAAFTGAF